MQLSHLLKNIRKNNLRVEKKKKEEEKEGEKESV